MKKIIPYSRHMIDIKDIDYVKKSLLADNLTNGKFLNLLENKLKKYVKSKHAVACSNGTAGIYISYKAIGIKKNSVIIIPSINFLAAFNMATILGAKIFLADVDSSSGQMSPLDLENCIKKNKLKKIDLVVTMYNGGCPLHARKFFELKKKYKFKILEDACHALGASYDNHINDKVGCCKYSDISVFSLHPQKTITAGEGGAVTTNNNLYYKKLLLFRNHGIIRKKSNKNFYFWKYIVKEPSFNFRLSEINCALAFSQLNKITSFVKKREKIAKAYLYFFKNNKNIVFPNYYNNCNSAWHLFFVKLKNNSKIKRDKLIQFLYKKKIFTQVHYIPIFFQPKFKKLRRNYKFDGAKSFYNKTLSIPIFPKLSLLKVKKIAYEINKLTM